MTLYFDVDIRKFIFSPGVRDVVTALEFKRGDNLAVDIRFVSGIAVIELENDAAGQIGFKPTSDYDGAIVAGASSWVKTGVGAATVYTLDINFNTVALNTLLGSGAPADVPFVILNMELQYTANGRITSSNTILATIHNDVIKGDEGIPISLLDPGEWVANLLGTAAADATTKANAAQSAAQADATTKANAAQAASIAGDAKGSRLLYGLEWAHAIRVATAETGTVDVGLYGDSTMTDAYFNPYYTTGKIISRFVDEQAWACPVIMTNFGASGTTIADVNLLPALAPTTKLLIIRYGINDGLNPAGTRLATFVNTYASKLAAVRAATYGDLDNLTIVLMAPTSTNDTPNGRDDEWYRQLREVFFRLSDDYQCVFFDTYNFLPMALGLAGISHDDPYSDGRAIHFGDQTNALIFNTMLNGMFPPGFGRNRNPTYDAGLLASAPPVSYAYGVSINRAFAAGWPLDGQVYTVRHKDGSALQTISNYNGEVTHVMFRSGYKSYWNPWQRMISTSSNNVAETPTPTHTRVLYDAAGNAFKVPCIPL